MLVNVLQRIQILATDFVKKNAAFHQVPQGQPIQEVLNMTRIMLSKCDRDLKE